MPNVNLNLLDEELEIRNGRGKSTRNRPPSRERNRPSRITREDLDQEDDGSMPFRVLKGETTVNIIPLNQRAERIKESIMTNKAATKAMARAASKAPVPEKTSVAPADNTVTDVAVSETPAQSTTEQVTEMNNPAVKTQQPAPESKTKETEVVNPDNKGCIPSTWPYPKGEVSEAGDKVAEPEVKETQTLCTAFNEVMKDFTLLREDNTSFLTKVVNAGKTAIGADVEERPVFSQRALLLNSEASPLARVGALIGFMEFAAKSLQLLTLSETDGVITLAGVVNAQLVGLMYIPTDDLDPGFVLSVMTDSLEAADTIRAKIGKPDLGNVSIDDFVKIADFMARESIMHAMGMVEASDDLKAFSAKIAATQGKTSA